MLPQLLHVLHYFLDPLLVSGKTQPHLTPGHQTAMGTKSQVRSCEFVIGTVAGTHGCCGDLHGGVKAAALSGHLPVVVHDRMFRHLLFSHQQAAVHRYLCQCHWRTEEITIRFVTPHSKLAQNVRTTSYSRGFFGTFRALR